MIKRLKPFNSPSEYLFKDPDTGREFKAPNMKEISKAIVSYREQNKLEPIEYLHDTIENYLCSLPQNEFMCQPNPKITRTFTAWVKGGVTLVKNLYYKAFVPQVTADRRSEICAGCPHNKFPDKDGFVKWSDEIAEKSVGTRKSKMHNMLGTCEICTCPLRPKVWYVAKKYVSDEEYVKLPDFCWQKVKGQLDGK